jgi:hypothetical protein
METCQSFTNCSAAICPLCQNGSEIWFTDEPICGKHGMAEPFPWIKTQRKLARKSEQNHEIGYFTVETLAKIRKVGPNTPGCDPDTPGRRARFERKVRPKHTRNHITDPERIKTLREGLARYRSSKKHGLEEK